MLFENAVWAQRLLGVKQNGMMINLDGAYAVLCIEHFPTKLLYLFYFSPIHAACFICHSPLFGHLSDIQQLFQIMKFLIMHFSPASCCYPHLEVQAISSGYSSHKSHSCSSLSVRNQCLFHFLIEVPDSILSAHLVSGK